MKDTSISTDEILTVISCIVCITNALLTFTYTIWQKTTAVTTIIDLITTIKARDYSFYNKKGSNGKIEVTKNNSSNDSMVFESSEFELAQFDCTLIILIHLVKPVYKGH
jgi:hypothetical protein